MNCKNVDLLLSLYVGGDLEEGDSKLVAAHLQSCPECARAGDEYARASHLLQGYDPPTFSDVIYAGIREQVLNEIERESSTPVWPTNFSQLFLALVQPQIKWITAALLLAISVIALYLNRKPSRELPNDPQVAVRTAEPKQALRGVDVMSTTSSQITRKRKPNSDVVATSRSRELVKATKVDSSNNDRVVQRAVGVSQPSSAPAPLRVEIQTNDRNIRIIWLSGQRPDTDAPDADARHGSKGI